MKVFTEDDFLFQGTIKNLNKRFLYDLPHYYRGFSASDDENNPTFYHSKLDIHHPEIKNIHHKISKKLTKINLELTRCYINIQHQGMDGGFHADDGDITFLIMITPNPTQGGGDFEYINSQNQIQKIPYKQNKLVVFDAKIQHRGLSYNNPSPRITLAFKNNIISNDH